MRRAWSTFVVTAWLALAASAMTAAAAEPVPDFIGTWAVLPDDCKAGQDQPNAPMILTLKGFDQHETHCRFDGVKLSKGRWKTVGYCGVDGDRQIHHFDFLIDEGKLEIQEKALPVRSLFRCG